MVAQQQQSPSQINGSEPDNDYLFDIANDDPEEPLDVLDLPPIYRKPSAQVLLHYLSVIATEPPSWDVDTAALIKKTFAVTTSQQQQSPPSPRRPQSHRRELHGNPAKWLTNIVASPLHWITDESLQEQVRNLASIRLSERCGRTAMPAVTRTFRILNEVRKYDGRNVDGLHTDIYNSLDELKSTASVSTGLEEEEEIHIILHEPTMDGDNLGLKTWGAAYMLAKRLGLLKFRELVGLSLPMMVTATPPCDLSLENDNETRKNRALRILELGSGTGLVGIAAAAVLSSLSRFSNNSMLGNATAISIHLTDLPEVVPNLTKNISLNLDKFASGNTKDCNVDISLTAGVLDWREDVTPANTDDKYPFIIVADPLYSKDHPKWLTDVIAGWLERNSTARAVVELPLREVYIDVVKDFWGLMVKNGLELVEQGEEVGRDDWGSRSDGEEMKCWWGVWKWIEE